MGYTSQQVASFRAGAARGSQVALLMAAIAGAAAQTRDSFVELNQSIPEEIEAGTRFQPPQTPRVDGREITLDIDQV